MLIASEIRYLYTPFAIACTALLAWVYHRKIAARRATIDFISKTEAGNQAWQSQRAFFFKRFPDGTVVFMTLLQRQIPCTDFSTNCVSISIARGLIEP